MTSKPLLTRIPNHFITTITFDESAGGGATGTAVPVGTVSGRIILVYHSIYCSTSLTGASATIELGTAGDTDAIIGATTATDIDAGDFWQPGPASPAGAGAWDTLQNTNVAANLIITPVTANVTAGVLEVVFFWLPASVAGSLD